MRKKITDNLTIALFVVETIPSFFFAPCGLINSALNFGPATILSFFPNFQYGSLLIVVSLNLNNAKRLNEFYAMLIQLKDVIKYFKLILNKRKIS